MSNLDFNERTWQLLEKALTASVEESRRQRRWKIVSRVLTLLIVLAVAASAIPSGSLFTGLTSGSHTAVVKLEGEIDANSPASADVVITGLRKAFDSPKSKAVVLLVNSPGGSPVQAGYINDEIMRLRAKNPSKKIYAVIRDVGASGAYYAASAADEIFADKASIVGSIGVISEGFGFDKVLEKFGVERRVFHAGENKSFLDPYTALKQSQVDRWQTLLHETHEQFIAAVKNGRGQRLKDNPELYSGLVWNGEQALELGLVDHLGSASYVAREVVNAETIVDYSIVPGPFNNISRTIGAAFGQGLLSALSPSTTFNGLSIQ